MTARFFVGEVVELPSSAARKSPFLARLLEGDGAAGAGPSVAILPGLSADEEARVSIVDQVPVAAFRHVAAMLDTGRLPMMTPEEFLAVEEAARYLDVKVDESALPHGLKARLVMAEKVEGLVDWVCNKLSLQFQQAPYYHFISVYRTANEYTHGPHACANCFVEQELSDFLHDDSIRGVFQKDIADKHELDCRFDEITVERYVEDDYPDREYLGWKIRFNIPGGLEAGDLRAVKRRRVERAR